MSQQNVQTMRDACEAFNRQDIAAAVAVYDPEIEWVEPGGGRAPAGIFHGPQSVVADVLAAVPQTFDAFQVEPAQLIDAGDDVVIVGRYRGTAKSGATLDAPFVQVWRMRDGKVVGFRHYVDPAAWAAAWDG